MVFEAQVQNSDKFPFREPKEVAELATRAGLSVREFMKLYLDNLNEATQDSWHTVTRFKVKILDIATSPTNKKDKFGKPIMRATIQYLHGTNYEKTQALAINGLLTTGYRTTEIYNKAKEAIGKEVLLYRAYDKQKYAVIIDIDIL